MSKKSTNAENKEHTIYGDCKARQTLRQDRFSFLSLCTLHLAIRSENAMCTKDNCAVLLFAVSVDPAIPACGVNVMR